jgi:putative ABC transport system permease protein
VSLPPLGGTPDAARDAPAAAEAGPRQRPAAPNRQPKRRRLSWSNLLYIYRSRLRSRNVIVQDTFAVAGIAVGVALLFAAQVASTSLTRSVQRLSSQLVGTTQYQLDARGPAGVSERVLSEARRIPGVKVALPVLEQQAQVLGANGQVRSVDLIGTDPRFAHFGGPLLRRFSAAQLAAQRAIALPTPIADAIGVGSLQTLQIQVGARVITTLLGATLDTRDIGNLVNSPVALAPVAYAQQLTGMTGRISRVFVQAQPGRDKEVLAGLDRVAARANVNVESASYDSRLFSVAALPENQGETLFSIISALVGFLLAINAMLITVPRRRRMLAHVKHQGATRRMVLQLLLFDAAVIGVLACVLGLALGDVLSLTVLHATPGYLSFAFPVGNGRIVTWQSIAEAVIAGMLAASAGMLLPLRDAFMPAKWRSVVSPQWWVGGRAVLGIGGFATTTIILIAHPAGSNLGNITLVVALLCALPFLFNVVVASFARMQSTLNRASPRVTLTHLRVPKTRVRSLAIIATAAVAVFGVVSIQGAQRNLQRGLDASATGIDSGADIWVTPRGESNAFATTPFSDAKERGTLARLPGVKTVSEYRGSFITWGDRRLWVLGPPSNSTQVIPASQIVSGDLRLADARLREGGWAVLSRELAAEHGLHVGQPFVLPSPTPTVFRVAALSTNLGWPPGAVIVNAGDYARAWGSSEPSAYEIDTRPGFPAATVRRAVQSTLGSSTGLVAETSGERQQRHFNLAKQGLLRLTEIRFLVLIAAMLAIAGALGSLIWQRRGYVAFVRALGFRRPVLWRWLLWEGAILLGIGCLTGATFGVYGQLLMSHALASVTGFPISFDVEALVALSTFAVVSAAAALVVSIAGYLMVRVPPRAARPAS